MANSVSFQTIVSRAMYLKLQTTRLDKTTRQNCKAEYSFQMALQSILVFFNFAHPCLPLYLLCYYFLFNFCYFSQLWTKHE